MKSRSAFTVLEVLILTVIIIGLLAAIVIPAIQAVRQESIIEAVESGKRVSREDLKWYKEKFGEPKSLESAGEININGKTYILIEKQ